MTGTGNVRIATAADLDAIHAIEEASFSTPWSRVAFRDFLLSDAARLIVATDASTAIAGFAAVVLAPGEAELANLAVRPDVRRTGIARDMVRYALIMADSCGPRDVFLEVRASNAAARALYASFGFVEVGRRRAYYRLPEEDALVLRRSGRGAAR